MQHQQNQIVAIDPVQPDCHSSKIPDLTDLLSYTLFIFGLLTSIKNLLKSIDKLKKQQKLDMTILLQMLGAVLTIVKAIGQLFDSLDDRDDEE